MSELGNLNISGISVNSDCQIMEPNLTTIEIEDDENNKNEPSVICIDDIGSVNVNSINADPIEENEISKKLSCTNVIFRITFNSQGKFFNLKNSIISSLNTCFKEKNLDIELLEDEILFDIAAIDKTIKNDEKQPLFTISASPFLTTAEREIRSMIPSYKRTIRDVLDMESCPKKLKVNEDSAKPKPMCFNCNGDHQLKDCELPRNSMKINQNRKNLRLKSERYHIDIEQRFAHLKPGKLSESLKKALGLRDGELPSFFYRMRVLGYPPGWLEDTKEAHSGIMLFDSAGRAVLGSDDEEGEVDGTKHKYNIRKIISFPGFNVHPGRGYFDDHKHYGVPPIDAKQSKIKFIQELGENIAKEGYKRKKFKIPEAVDDIPSKEPVDMEIEEEDGEISDSLIDTAPPLPPNEDIPDPPALPVDNEEINNESLTITDLELQQRELLKALNSSDLTNLGPSTPEKPSTLPHLECSVEAQPLNKEEFNESIEKSESPEKKNLTLGTPVLKFSPYDKLPTDDLWRVGVSDVINFENLPDSTGKYIQMKRLLNKVRRKVAKINASEG